MSGDRPPAPRLHELFSAEKVKARVAEIARQIVADHAGSEPLLVVIAEGAKRFAAALEAEVRALGGKIGHVVVRARRTKGETLVPVEVEPFDSARCRDRHVVIVDDIADEGRTLDAVLKLVAAAAPRRVRTAVLVSKHARRRIALELDYVGFDVEDGWIVGFGMDLHGRLREVDFLAVVVPP